MARRRVPLKSRDWLFPGTTQAESPGESSLLDVLDSVLNKGAVLNGDVVLGVANVDLVYIKLSVLLGALDRVMEYEGRRTRSPKVNARGRRGSPKKK
jgi:hypothetical protein